MVWSDQSCRPAGRYSRRSGGRIYGVAAFRSRLRAMISVSHALYRAIETLITPRTVLPSVIASVKRSNADPVPIRERDCEGESEILRVASVEAVVISYSNSICLP